MARRQLSSEEAVDVLASGDLVRVAFRDGPSTYLIPLGYVWLPSVLCGVGDAGRKTRLAEQDPTVAFQVDTSAGTGLFEWRSVTGTGRFEIVTDAQERRQVLEALKPVIDLAPGWWRREQAPRMAAGANLVWKITPTEVAGCEYARPTG